MGGARDGLPPQALQRGVHLLERRFDLVAEISDPDHHVEMRETAVAALGSVGRYQEARQFAAEHEDMSRALSRTIASTPSP